MQRLVDRETFCRIEMHCASSAECDDVIDSAVKKGNANDVHIIPKRQLQKSDSVPTPQPSHPLLQPL